MDVLPLKDVYYYPIGQLLGYSHHLHMTLVVWTGTVDGDSGFGGVDKHLYYYYDDVNGASSC